MNNKNSLNSHAVSHRLRTPCNDTISVSSCSISIRVMHLRVTCHPWPHRAQKSNPDRAKGDYVTQLKLRSVHRFWSIRVEQLPGFELTGLGGWGFNPPSSPAHSIVTPPPTSIVPAVLLTLPVHFSQFEPSTLITTRITRHL